MNRISGKSACLLLAIACLMACNPKKKDEISFEAKPGASSPPVTEASDQSAPVANDSKPQASPSAGIVPAGDQAIVSSPGKAPADEPVAAVPPPVKVCDPNYTKIASPKPDHHFYYVTGFQPGEFKCWVELENQGKAICDSLPCVVYFVDKANIKPNMSHRHYMSPEELKSACIGRFEYNGKY